MRSAGARVAKAFHEAGHAVVAHHLGVRYPSVTVNMAAASLGEVVLREPPPQLDAVERHSATVERPPTRLRSFVEGHILVAWAGPLAERRHTGRYNWRDARGDVESIWPVAELISHSDDESKALVEWLRARADAVLAVERTWAEVTAVADVLQREGVLTPSEVSLAIDGVSAATWPWQRPLTPSRTPSR